MSLINVVVDIDRPAPLVLVNDVASFSSQLEILYDNVTFKSTSTIAPLEVNVERSGQPTLITLRDVTIESGATIGSAAPFKIVTAGDAGVTLTLENVVINGVTALGSLVDVSGTGPVHVSIVGGSFGGNTLTSAGEGMFIFDSIASLSISGDATFGTTTDAPVIALRTKVPDTITLNGVSFTGATTALSVGGDADESTNNMTLIDVSFVDCPTPLDVDLNAGSVDEIRVVGSTFDNSPLSLAGVPSVHLEGTTFTEVVGSLPVLLSNAGTVLIDECDFTDNEGQTELSALQVDAYTSITIVGSTFTGNSRATRGTEYGAVVYIARADSSSDTIPVSISDSTFSDNTGAQRGQSVIEFAPSLAATITDVSFSNNLPSSDIISSSAVNFAGTVELTGLALVTSVAATTVGNLTIHCGPSQAGLERVPSFFYRNGADMTVLTNGPSGVLTIDSIGDESCVDDTTVDCCRAFRTGETGHTGVVSNSGVVELRAADVGHTVLFVPDLVQETDSARVHLRAGTTALDYVEFFGNAPIAPGKVEVQFVAPDADAVDLIKWRNLSPTNGTFDVVYSSGGQGAAEVKNSVLAVRSLFVCTGVNDCSGHGTCVGIDECNCEKDWDADGSGLCNSPDCSKRANCSNHGTCVGPQTCDCDEGWDGILATDGNPDPFCGTPACSPPCEGATECVAPPSTCVCPQGFTGPPNCTDIVGTTTAGEGSTPAGGGAGNTDGDPVGTGNESLIGVFVGAGCGILLLLACLFFSLQARRSRKAAAAASASAAPASSEGDASLSDMSQYGRLPTRNSEREGGGDGYDTVDTAVSKGKSRAGTDAIEYSKLPANVKKDEEVVGVEWD
jgi:hypothetical protein